MAFDDVLLNEFAHNFCGYGNFEGAYWFVGMEEGAGNDISEIYKRLDSWKARGKKQLEDVAEYHIAFGIEGFFNENAEIQPTWGSLIKILLSSQRISSTPDVVRQYQREKLGRANGETCLLELLPLPSYSTDEARFKRIYSDNSQLPFLENRRCYMKKFVQRHIERLQELIRAYEPKVVVCYGTTYRKHWLNIANPTRWEESEGVCYGSNQKSFFVIMPHPRPRNGCFPDSHFLQIGKEIANRSEVALREERGES